MIALVKTYQEIPLVCGKVALVDPEDYEYLSQWQWRIYIVDGTPKIGRSKPEGGTIWMHREVARLHGANIPKIKYLNGNKLDNRFCNLGSAAPVLTSVSVPPPLPSVENKIIFSAKQLEVARLMIRGLSTVQIGKKLYLSFRSVEYYRSAICLKLGVKNCTEATAVLLHHPHLLENALGSKSKPKSKPKLPPIFLRRDRSVTLVAQQELLACYEEIKRLKEQRLSAALALSEISDFARNYTSKAMALINQELIQVLQSLQP